jgi:hypothetical protein
VVPYVTAKATGRSSAPWWSTAASHATQVAAHRSGGPVNSTQPLRLNADGTVALASASARTDRHNASSAVTGWPAAVGIAAIAVLALGTGLQLRRRHGGA